jgi:hypothetical protein
MTEDDSLPQSHVDSQTPTTTTQSGDFASIIKNGSDIQIQFIGLIFIIIDFLLIFTVFLSLGLLIIFYYTNLSRINFFSDISNLNLQNFIMTFTPLIEFILFITILVIICAGIYVSIIHKIFVDRNLSLSQLIPDIVKFFGLPFLTMVGSLLAVSMLNIIMMIYKKSHIDNNVITQNEYLFDFGLILCIVIAIIGLSILIKTEHQIQE